MSRLRHPFQCTGLKHRIRDSEDLDNGPTAYPPSRRSGLGTLDLPFLHQIISRFFRAGRNHGKVAALRTHIPCSVGRSLVGLLNCHMDHQCCPARPCVGFPQHVAHAQSCIHCTEGQGEVETWAVEPRSTVREVPKFHLLLGDGSP